MGAISQLQTLEEALSVAQHHDAASGTAKQHVTFDYQKRIAAGVIEAEQVLSAGLSVLTGVQGKWERCARLNETVCDLTQHQTVGSEIKLSVWNQLGQARVELIRIPVASTEVTVRDGSGQTIAVQIDLADETLTNYKRNTAEAKFVATFEASLLAAGFAVFTISLPAKNQVETECVVSASDVSAAEVVIENEFLSLSFSGSTSLMQAMSNKHTRTKISAVQSFCFYKGNEGEKRLAKSRVRQ